MGLEICINLGGSDTVDQALGSTQLEDRSPGTLENLPPLVGWKILSVESKQVSPEICSQVRPAHEESCSQDWGTVQWSRQQGLEVVPA